MTEYKDEVEFQRRKLILETWGKKWQSIYIEYGDSYVQYNSGSVEINGVVMKPADSLEEQWSNYEREEYGNSIKVS
tara:strand:- start:20648 stop:20875 length:228 start_codon:yes stop_codon:yes gene_type:complete